MVEASEKLTDEVLADARQKAERARRRGAREAEEVRERLEGEGRAAAGEWLSAARRQAQAAREQILATTEIEVQRERLASLEAELQKAYESAVEELSHLDSGRAREALLRLALEALKQLPPGVPAVLALSERDHAALGPQLAADVQARAAHEIGRGAEVRLSDRPAPVTDGVVVRSADGKTEIVQSFGERLRRLWPDLRLQVAATLFPDEFRAKER